MNDISNRHQVQFEREKTALKYYLIGKGYHLALKAMGFAERYHVGLRKDGKTPEFHHQVRIALTITQLKGITNEEMKLVLAFTHDAQEDHQIPQAVMREEFGVPVADKNWKLTKKFDGLHKNKEEYIEIISEDEDTSIVKGVDRNDNLDKMLGVFSAQKMFDYAFEAETVFLPMLKRASRLFPEQMAAYLTISQEMKKKIIFIKAYVNELQEVERLAALVMSQQADLNKRVIALEDTMEQKIARVQQLENENRILHNNSNVCSDKIQKVCMTTGSISVDLHIEAVKELLEAKFKSAVPGKQKYLEVMGIVQHTMLSAQPDRRFPSITDEMIQAAIAKNLAVYFGVSQLELLEFDAKKISGPIPSE